MKKFACPRRAKRGTVEVKNTILIDRAPYETFLDPVLGYVSEHGTESKIIFAIKNGLKSSSLAGPFSYARTRTNVFNSEFDLWLSSSEHIVQRILRLRKKKLLQSVVVKGIFGYVLASNEKQTLKKTNH